MFARNMETGRLGGERGNSGTTRTPSAASTLLPPSTMRRCDTYTLMLCTYVYDNFMMLSTT